VADVAVAVGLTLSVTSPYYAALGGGGFALIKMNSVVDAIDFRESAVKAVSPAYFAKLDKNASITGGRAVATPGFPAGLYAIHQKYGKLKWVDLFKEVLELSGKGFPVSGEWARQTRDERDRFTAGGVKTFFRKGVALKPGDILQQPGLTKALTLLRAKGPKGFYEGEVAKDIVDSVVAAGGEMTVADVRDYKVRWLSPISTDYEGYKVYLMPPPSSGGVVIASALKMIEKSGLKDKTAPMSIDEYHLMGEIQARAFRGRMLLGDPDFAKNPVAYLTSNEYAAEMLKSVDPAKSVAPPPLRPEEFAGKESTETTHYSVMDASGHAISLTVTLNGNYGSAVVSPRFGIALNNEMDDFTTHVGEPNMFGLTQGLANDVRPGKRPLSSMSPTLVEKRGKLVAAIGAPGGPRIISGVLQGIYRLLARNLDADLAIQTARVHHQYSPNILYIDKHRFTPETLAGLRTRGHELKEGSTGKVYIIHLRDDGILEASFDSRGEGSAGGI
jgi:gamma-glutamyltranspeptidase/glutathione hydrolase